MSRVKWIVVVVAGLTLCAACSQGRQELPYLGPLQVEGTDTSYYEIPDFVVIDQDSQVVSRKTLAGDIFVADFFFTTCPTICPKMKKQMVRVYEKFSNNPHVGILSHTIDPRHDSVEVLQDFAEKLDVSAPAWHFVTGHQDSIYSIGKKSYMVTAREAPDQPGGLLHSGAFILVDKNKQVRGMYDGTKPAEVNQLMNDMEKLLSKQFPKQAN
jgi:protein SCO1/2